MEKTWNKNIVLFLFSQTISLFGSMLVQYAITWHITIKTQSGIMMMLSIICGFVPAFFLSPFAGVWADRYNRKMLIVLSDSLIALSTLILAIVFLLGYDSIVLLFVTMAIRSLGTAVHTPTVGAFLPQLVSEDKLTKVNAVNGSIQSIIMLISPMLSGALLSFADIEAIFFIDVVTAAIAVFILLAFLNVPIHAKAAEKQKIGYFADMSIGLNYIKKHCYIKHFFVFSAFFFFLVSPPAFLTALQVTRTFGNEVWRLTVIEVCFSLGMMSGGIIIATWGGFKNKIHTMAAACIVMSTCTIMLGIVPIFWIYSIFMFLVGVALPMFNTPSTVLLQEKVEADFLGRVFGAFGMISGSVMPGAMLLFGPLADAVKIEWLLIVTGTLLFIQSFFLLWDKVLVNAGKPSAEPEIQQ